MSQKLTLTQAAVHFGVSKEAIYNRLRRGSLESVVEDGVKYVLLEENPTKTTQKTIAQNSFQREFIELLQLQVQELKMQNAKLELDKDTLIKEKEKLLIESKEKIESIYRSRDEHLKTILSLANTKAVAHNHVDANETVIQEADFEEEQVDLVDQICETFEDWIEIDEYLEVNNYDQEASQIIKQKLLEQLGKNKNIKRSSGEIFIKKGKKLKKIIGKFA
ncbi:MAG: integrase [Sulfurospirillum sp.]|nr:integrase [Sulfurospirillum sp.]